ncbi:MAG: HlyD family efflux transporter periplasmic adaptor subunit [Nannocystaceae bacterium]|nr:HlyD family efflux transporter periplasmic adaptor subunit [Nannocystaceae bacterium]
MAAGRTVLELVGDDALELEVQLPESILADVHEGQTVQVELPLLDRTVSGRITTIAAAAPQSAGLFPVIVTLSEAVGVHAGQTARLVVSAPIAEGLIVPVEAVIDRSGAAPRLLAVRDGTIAVREIKILAIAGRHAVIQGEVAAGDWVVSRGHATLADGDKVTVNR